MSRNHEKCVNGQEVVGSVLVDDRKHVFLRCPYCGQQSVVVSKLNKFEKELL